MLIVTTALAGVINVTESDSIQEAVDSASAGQIIALATGGTWNESITLGAVSDGSADVRLVGEGVTVMGTAPVATISGPSWQVEGIAFVGTGGSGPVLEIGSGVDKLGITEVGVSGSDGSCVRLTGATELLLDQMTISDCGGHGLEASDFVGLTFRNGEVSDVGGYAVHLESNADWGTSVVDQGHIVNAGGGVYAASTADQEVTLYVGPLEASGVSGVAVHGGPGVFVRSNQVMVTGGGTGLLSEGGTVASYNSVFSDLDVGIESREGGLTVTHVTLGRDLGTPFIADDGYNITVKNTLFHGEVPDAAEWHSNLAAGDDDFVDAPGGDYHLVSTSGAIDQGEGSTVEEDMDGEGRDEDPDVGADEYSGAFAGGDTGAGDTAGAGDGGDGGDGRGDDTAASGGGDGGTDGCGCTAGLGGGAWFLGLLTWFRRRFDARPVARMPAR